MINLQDSGVKQSTPKCLIVSQVCLVQWSYIKITFSYSLCALFAVLLLFAVCSTYMFKGVMAVNSHPIRCKLAWCSMRNAHKDKASIPVPASHCLGLHLITRIDELTIHIFLLTCCAKPILVCLMAKCTYKTQTYRPTDIIIIIISRLLKVDKRNHNTMRKKRKQIC